MMQGDLMIDIQEPSTQCSSEIQELYRVFKKLKIVLRFGDEEFFTRNNAETLMNLSQALRLFRDFQNLKGVRMCCSSIGVIHFQSHRYEEAMDNFTTALAIAKGQQDLSETNQSFLLHSWAEDPKQGQLVLTCANRVAETLMEISLHSTVPRWQEAITILSEAVEGYDKKVLSYDFISSLLILASAYTHNAQYQLARDMIEKVHWILRAYETGVGDIPIDVIRGKLLFTEGLLAESVGDFQIAGELYTDSLTLTGKCDPDTRLKCLIGLRHLFETQGIECWQVNQLIEDYQTNQIDIVFLIEYTGNMKPNHRMQRTIANVLTIFDRFLGADDRVSLILFNNNTHIAFHLTGKSKNTEFLRRHIVKWSKPKGATRQGFADGVSIALSQFESCAGDADVDYELLDTSTDTPASSIPKRVKWILACMASDDSCSETTLSQMQTVLQYLSFRQAQVNLFCVCIQLQEESKAWVQSLCSSTRKGRMVSCGETKEIDDAFHLFMQMIPPMKKPCM